MANIYARRRKGALDDSAALKWIKRLEAVRMEDVDEKERMAEEERKRKEEEARARAELQARMKKVEEWKRAREAEKLAALFCDFCGAKGKHASAECPEKEALQERLEKQAAAARASKAAMEAAMKREREAARKARGGKPQIDGVIPEPSSFLDEVTDRGRIEGELRRQYDEAVESVGKTSKKAQECLRRLTEFYKRRGKLEDCEQLFSRMAEEVEEEDGPFHVNLLRPLMELGKVLVLMK